MPDPIPREPRRDDPADDDGTPFWLSPWPFLEPRYPNDPWPDEADTSR